MSVPSMCPVVTATQRPPFPLPRGPQGRLPAPMPAAAASYFDRPPPAPRPLRIANLLSVFLLFVLLAGGLTMALLHSVVHR